LVVAFVYTVAALVKMARHSKLCFAANPFRNTAAPSNGERADLWRATHHA
jgi:hypothetical protein